MRYFNAVLSILIMSCGEPNPGEIEDAGLYAEYMVDGGVPSWDALFEGNTEWRSDVSSSGFESARRLGAVTCPMDEYPQNCYDGACWSTRVSCGDTVFECGGLLHRCIVAGNLASCCDNTFRVCPWTHPFYCPQPEREGCHRDRANCNTADVYLCKYRSEECSY